MEDKKDYTKKINKALIKRALGYSCKEVVEEFSSNDGNMVLTKRKVTKKNVPPDMSAVKILLNINSDENVDFSEMTEEELIIERDKLLKLLKEEKYD